VAKINNSHFEVHDNIVSIMSDDDVGE